ncbi:MAG: rlmA [Phycisphaerales bacterium]|nr:rlmA [Phycisphaerales bacterium]
MTDNQWGNVAREELLNMVPADGKVIGSIGCNFGSTEVRLVEQGREVHGVDIDPTVIAVAATRLTSARVIDPNDRHPFEKNSLDGLILADVLEHIPSAWDALATFSEAVRPGGWIIISVPNMRFIPAAVRFAIGGDWPEHPSGIFDRTHVQVMSKKRLNRWCQQAGLIVERWFDRYPPHNRRRELAFKAVDLLTLRLFHNWFMFQILVLCRKPGGSS